MNQNPEPAPEPKRVPTFPPDKLQKNFESFMQAAYHGNVKPASHQWNEQRNAFFAGCLAHSCAVGDATKTDDEDLACARLELLHREITSFGKESMQIAQGVARKAN